MGNILLLIGAILAALYFMWESIHWKSSKNTANIIEAMLVFGMCIAGFKGFTLSASMLFSSCSIILYLEECYKK